MATSETNQTNEQGRIRAERRGDVFEMVIDRPAKMNGFTPAMLRGLAERYTEYEQSDARCALLRAEGPHFTAGLDLKSVQPTDALWPPGLIDPLSLRAPIRTKPVVQAVHGVCFTIGIELGLANDIVVAAEDTRFSQLEVKRGLFAFGGATLRMPERAGWGNAMRWLLTGDELTAAEAHRLGFVQELCEASQVLERARALADRIAAQSPLAVQATLRSARLAEAAAREAAVASYPGEIEALVKSEDFAEGVRSFVERRAGQYRGR